MFGYSNLIIMLAITALNFSSLFAENYLSDVNSPSNAQFAVIE